MASYRVSNAAKNDIRKIATYTQKQWGKDKRRQYLADMQDKFTLLAENPLMVRENNGTYIPD